MCILPHWYRQGVLPILNNYMHFTALVPSESFTDTKYVHFAVLVPSESLPILNNYVHFAPLVATVSLQILNMCILPIGTIREFTDTGYVHFAAFVSSENFTDIEYVHFAALVPSESFTNTEYVHFAALVPSESFTDTEYAFCRISTIRRFTDTQ